jgi:hypothetical protein
VNILQKLKFLNITPPAAAVDNASVVTTEVDRKNADSMVYIVQLGATDIAMSAFKVTESDEAGTGHTDIEDAAFTGVRLPSDSADNNLYAIFVDCVGRKRYIDLVLTAGNGAVGTFVSVLAILADLRETPMDATARGLADQILV